jgi:hypothetical protein
VIEDPKAKIKDKTLLKGQRIRGDQSDSEED